MSNSQPIYFVSDLHMFSSRSQEGRYLAELERKAANAGHFVLGGDIFDFRWSSMSSHEETAARAVHWLNKLVGDCPTCNFHYVLGNHDYHAALLERLDRLAEKQKNFSWEPFYLRLGCSIFLHGDAADRMATGDELAAARIRWMYKKKRGRVANRLYDMAVEKRLHMPFIHLARTKKLTAKRILAYLRDVGETPAGGVKNVYFGHTHLALSNFRFGGVMFHNSGAPMEGLRFAIIEAVI